MLDIDPEKAFERKNRNASDLEKGCFQRGFENDGFIIYQQRLRHSYLQIASVDNRFFIVDGERSINGVHNEIRAHLSKIWEK